MLRTLPLLLCLVVALTGCRESVTGPDPITPPTSTPVVETTPLYVKGPDALRVNERGAYRAEPLFDPNLDHYEWSYLGDGHLTATPVDPQGLDRLVEALAREAGTVLLRVRAYDAEGNRIAAGAKEVTITPY